MPEQQTAIARGLKKGHPTTKYNARPKQAGKKGTASKRTKFVRSLIRDVVGFAPYERRVIELIKNSRDKRARRLAKKRLGTMKRAKRKIEDLTNVIAEQRRAAAH